MESTLISIPYWYRWCVTLTSNTGPIFCISSNPAFRCGSFIIIIWRWRKFSAWTSISESCQFHVTNCHKILPTRNLFHKTSIFASFTRSNVFWNIFESSVVATQPVSPHWNCENTEWQYDCTCNKKHDWLVACSIQMCVHGSQVVYCGQAVRGKKQQGRNDVSVQRSMSM